MDPRDKALLPDGSVAIVQVKKSGPRVIATDFGAYLTQDLGPGCTDPWNALSLIMFCEDPARVSHLYRHASVELRLDNRISLFLFINTLTSEILTSSNLTDIV